MAARRFNQCSNFGGLLDMITDRCSTLGLLFILYGEYGTTETTTTTNSNSSSHIYNCQLYKAVSHSLTHYQYPPAHLLYNAINVTHLLSLTIIVCRPFIHPLIHLYTHSYFYSWQYWISPHIGLKCTRRHHFKFTTNQPREIPIDSSW